MITLQELNIHNYILTPEQEANIKVLFERINIIRAAYAKPMIITSGVRSLEDQMRINPKAPKSKHILAAACDVVDQDGSVHAWCLANDDLLRKTGLWLEERRGGWQHFQCLPFGSFKEGGKIWFIP